MFVVQVPESGLQERCLHQAWELFWNRQQVGAQVLDLLCLYAYKQASTASLMRECRMASEAIVNWRNYVEDIFTECFIRHPLQIGGPGHTVEIDESAFLRRKGHCWQDGEHPVGVWRNWCGDEARLPWSCATEGCSNAAANTAAVRFAGYHGHFWLVDRLQHDWPPWITASDSEPLHSLSGSTNTCHYKPRGGYVESGQTREQAGVWN